MESELDPDRIGERQFEVLCEGAGLYCNKSAVDVMGWDFILEFPMGRAGQALPLDQRPTNAARVRLKSTLSVSLHLKPIRLGLKRKSHLSRSSQRSLALRNPRVEFSS